MRLHRNPSRSQGPSGVVRCEPCCWGGSSSCPRSPFKASSEPEDRFAGEPTRPKAEAPVQFAKSWDQARAESKRTGRRILAVFTGDHCGWRRVLEKRTFTDAEVVKLSEQFVRVELNTGEEDHARLVDEYQVDTIPRSFVLTAEGQVVNKRTGYIPAAEYATWLQEARTQSPAPTRTETSAAVAPPPVGALESEADVIIWSIDASRSIQRWGDEDWTGHAQLLHLLRTAGLRPRVEHIARESFPSRWDRAEATGQVPELVMADQAAGLVRDSGTEWPPAPADLGAIDLDSRERLLPRLRGTYGLPRGRLAA